MDQKWKDLSGRAIRSTGRGVGKGSLGVLNWFSRHIVSGILMPGTIVFVAIFTIYWIWERRPFNVEKPPMTQVEIDQEQLECGAKIGWEDGQDRDERLFAFIAAYNLSQEGMSICDIARKFWTLRAPDHPVMRLSKRMTSIAENTRKLSTADEAQYAQLKIDFKSYVNDPKSLQQKYPWVSCVTHYKRTTYPGIYPGPDSRLDETMKQVFTSRSGAKYYCAR